MSKNTAKRRERRALSAKRRVERRSQQLTGGFTTIDEIRKLKAKQRASRQVLWEKRKEKYERRAQYSKAFYEKAIEGQVDVNSLIKGLWDRGYRFNTQEMYYKEVINDLESTLTPAMIGQILNERQALEAADLQRAEDFWESDAADPFSDWFN